MITAVIHEVLHRSSERVLVRLALQIHVLEWRLQRGFGNLADEIRLVGFDFLPLPFDGIQILNGYLAGPPRRYV